MASGNFPASVARVFAHEGGYVCNPADPGGATRLGVTQATLSAWRGVAVTKADVRNLGRGEAEAIYRADYWDQIGGDTLPAGLDYAAFDLAVNSGAGCALRYLQTLAKARGLYAGEVDAMLGAKTRAAFAAIPAGAVKALIRDLDRMRMTKLRKLAGWGTFGKGWSRRVSEVEAAALAMAAGTHVASADDLPDPVPTQRGAAVAVATGKTAGGQATYLAVAGTVGTAATAAANQLQPISDVLPAIKYAFAVLTCVGVAAGLAVAVHASKGADPKPGTPSPDEDDAEPVAEDPPAPEPELVPGAVISLPKGTVIPPATEPDPRVVSISERPITPAEVAAMTSAVPAAEPVPRPAPAEPVAAPVEPAPVAEPVAPAPAPPPELAAVGLLAPVNWTPA